MQFRIITLLFALMLSTLVTAQDQWPLQIPAEKGTITIYQPQPESYADGNVTARAAGHDQHAIEAAHVVASRLR